MHPEFKTSSFPRRRESISGRRAGAWKKWIPAFAGMTLFFASAMAFAEVETVHPPIQLSDQQEALYKSLLPELRCLVCQNESLAESQASLAADLRYEVRGLVAKGEDEAQVKKYLTDRYGDFVLYKPPFEKRTALLWAGPGLLMLTGLLMLLAYARRTRAAPAPAANADPAALKKILDENP
jgi:cytochrome c-type biogenesis protein CcmH